MEMIKATIDPEDVPLIQSTPLNRNLRPDALGWHLLNLESIRFVRDTIRHKGWI